VELTDHVEVLTSVVASQAETIREQNRTIEVLSGSRGKALNLDMPIREMWARYLQTLPPKKWVLSVKCTMVKFMDRHGDRPLGDLTVSFWEDYRDAPEIKDHYSVTSRNIQLKWLRAMLNWAVRSGRLAQNMLALAKLEKGKKKRQTEISFEGEAAVLRALDDLMRAFFLIGIDSAMRHDEIRMLEWSEIDWRQRTISIPASKTKTDKDRVARLTTRATEALRALPRYEGCLYVFANPKTKAPFTQSSLWYRWDKARTAAGLKAAPGDGTVHFHDTRATAASRIHRLGGTMPAVQQILGHAHLTTTALYIRTQSKDVIEAHALLENALRKGPHRAPSPSEESARVQRPKKIA